MKVHWDTRNFMRQVERERRGALKKAALVVVRSVKESMPDSGIAGATKKEREADRSKPGEPPHRQTGWLMKNINYELLGNDTARVGVNDVVKYAAILEWGGWTGRNHASYIAPRPYLRPALKREQANILRIFEGIF